MKDYLAFTRECQLICSSKPVFPLLHGVKLFIIFSYNNRVVPATCLTFVVYENVSSLLQQSLWFVIISSPSLCKGQVIIHIFQYFQHFFGPQYFCWG